MFIRFKTIFIRFVWDFFKNYLFANAFKSYSNKYILISNIRLDISLVSTNVPSAFN